MNSGLLWFDDSKQELVDKIAQAARRYEQKTGRRPSRCYVHPGELGGESITVDGVQVAEMSTVLKHHFWIGNGGDTDIEDQLSAVPDCVTTQLSFI
jgi:hypothetical protein